jgi:hypothetical protein
MWSFGRYTLRLASEEFWHLTMVEFSALVERHKEEQHGMYYRAAMVCSLIAETNRDKKKHPKPFTPDDFMPKAKKSRRMSDAKMSDALGVINSLLGGEVR